MKLSEALKFGIALRGEHHQNGLFDGRFVRTAQGELLSDAWGAAIEAIMPTVKDFNWDAKDPVKRELAMEAFRAIQVHYFKMYQQMAARCPGATQKWVEAGGRVIDNKGNYKIEGERVTDLGGVTSECDLVEHMYGMVDHLYYAHGWSRQQVADIVDWYERTRSNAALFVNFKHYQISGVKHLGGVQ